MSSDTNHGPDLEVSESDFSSIHSNNSRSSTSRSRPCIIRSRSCRSHTLFSATFFAFSNLCWFSRFVRSTSQPRSCLDDPLLMVIDEGLIFWTTEGDGEKGTIKMVGNILCAERLGLGYPAHSSKLRNFVFGEDFQKRKCNRLIFTFL